MLVATLNRSFIPSSSFAIDLNVWMTVRWGTMNAWSRMVEFGAIRTWIGVIELIIAMRFVRFVHTYSLARRINLFLQRTRNVSISSRGWTRWDSQNSPNSFFDALNL
jgi:hypothetical protein